MKSISVLFIGFLTATICACGGDSATNNAPSPKPSSSIAANSPTPAPTLSVPKTGITTVKA